MADAIIVAILFAEMVMIAVGTAIAYKVARLAEHAPRGWVLLTASFGTAFVRAIFFLRAYTLPSDPNSIYSYVGQLLGLPIVALILAGTYYLYKDFTKQLKESQARILNSEA